ncbi:hypothetical protein KC330_g2972 [Hortaea werneckii]|nr:hypothetical protein KC330_g2972 [Hortaea werneckii]
MAMAATDIASDVSEGEVSLPEIVFSCGSCQATPSELYAKRESNRGFHSGSGDEDGIVVKLWIADCSHITCNKHLPGGGTSCAHATEPYYLLTKSLAVPFHPKGQPPKAQCPQCVENGDSEVKSLYPIRGLQDGELDEQIPKEWLRCPPIKLDGEIPGMEALRHQFQYMNISRYAIRITKHWKSTAAKQRVMEAAYGKERKQRRQIQNEVLDLKSKIEGLEKCEARLAKWESRKPVINHYLGIVGDMAKEIKTLRDRLAELGYDAAAQDFLFNMAPWDGNRAPQFRENAGYQRHQTNSIHSKNAISEEQQQNSSGRKRRLSELVDGHNYHDPPLSYTAGDVSFNATSSITVSNAERLSLWAIGLARTAPPKL